MFGSCSHFRFLRQRIRHRNFRRKILRSGTAQERVLRWLSALALVSGSVLV